MPESKAGSRRYAAGVWAALLTLLPLAAGSADAGSVDVAPSVRAALALSGDVASGERLYEGCAACHQADGRGRADGTFPQLAGQHREVLIKQLVDIREGRRRNPIMVPYAEALIDAQELADVAAYIETLPLPRPVPSERAHTAQGRDLYARDCQSCHGERGEGEASRFVPIIAGQHQPYLLRQIRAIAAGRRANAHPWMQERVSLYTDAELQAVVDFAEALPGSVSDETAR